MRWREDRADLITTNLDVAEQKNSRCSSVCMRGRRRFAAAAVWNLNTAGRTNFERAGQGGGAGESGRQMYANGCERPSSGARSVAALKEGDGVAERYVHVDASDGAPWESKWQTYV
jgi:hypothetical protein